MIGEHAILYTDETWQNNDNIDVRSSPAPITNNNLPWNLHVNMWNIDIETDNVIYYDCMDSDDKQN